MKKGFVKATLACAAGVLLSGVIACGGGGGGSSSGGGGGGGGGGGMVVLKQGTTAGTVQLPAGSTVNPATLKVVTSLGQADVAADGKFTAKVYQGGPMMAFALDPTGKTVLFGFIEPGKGTISARSSAEALAYFSAGAYRLPAATRAKVLQGLATHAPLDAVATTISTRVAAEPTALENADAAIVDAVDLAMGEFAGASPLGHLIDPTETKSGIEVQGNALDTIKIVNYFRRRAVAYVDQVSYETEDGVEHPAPQELAKVDISPTVGVTSVVGSLSDLILGNSAYNPVATDPIDAGVRPESAKSTKYKVTVIGAGSSPGELDSLTQERQDEQEMVTMKTIVVDLVLPLILNVAMPANSEAIDQMLTFINGSAILADFINVISTVAPDIWTKSAAGDIVGVAWDLTDLVFNSPTVKVKLVELISAAITHFSGLFWGETFNNGAAAISKLTGAADIALSLLDTSAQIADIARSEQGSTWEVTATKSKVLLNPPYTVIGNGGEVELTCTIPNATDNDTDLVYHWTKEGGALQMTDEAGHTSNSFDSSKSKVKLKAAFDGSTGQDKIIVEAFRLVQGSKESLGTANASVKIGAPKPFINPHKISLKPNAAFSVTGGVKPAVEGQPTLLYKWSITGSGATIGGLLKKEGGPALTINAKGAEGTDTLTLEVVQLDRGKQISLGKATAEVRIETEPSIIYGTVRAKVWQDYGDGWTTEQWGVWVEFPDVEGATHYAVTGWDNYWNGPVHKAGPPFDDIRDMPDSVHGFGLTGGAGWYPGPPNDVDPNWEAGATSRFPGPWIVEVTK